MSNDAAQQAAGSRLDELYRHRNILDGYVAQIEYDLRVTAAKIREYERVLDLPQRGSNGKN